MMEEKKKGKHKDNFYLSPPIYYGFQRKGLNHKNY